MGKQTGIIILDGADCTGKTTIQQYFVYRMGAMPIHLTYPIPTQYIDMFDYHHSEMKRAIELSKSNLVIVDRHWISEKIYSTVLREGNIYPGTDPEASCKQMSDIWASHGAIYIICLPGFIKGAVERYLNNVDSKHPYTETQYTSLLLEYMKFWTESYLYRNDMLRYSIEFDGTNLDLFCEEAINFLNERRLKLNV